MRLISLLPVLCLSLVTTHASAAEQPPNIVLLISDDDDYEHFGFMGDQIARTPTLDALANSGSMFTTAHCPAPLCRPSLASLLSGRLPHQHGIYANYLHRKGVGNDTIKLDPTGSLANRLKDAGYATYATAKYWEGDPRAMGFTHGTVNTTFKGFQQFVRSDQDELNQFIDEQANKKPVFIWWAPLLPHKPHNPPERYLNQFAEAEIPIPAFFRGDREKYTAALRKFYAMGTWFDDGVSDLIEKLKAAGEYENTIFLFYVDNGYSFGIPAKNSPTEKGLRTPMFVSWPGKPDRIPSQRIDDPSYALDLHATALDYAGIDPPSDIASTSLRPKIEGKKATTKETIFGAVYAHAPANYSGDPSIEQSAQRDVYALYARTTSWKYVLYTQDLTDKNDRYIWMVHEMSDAFRRKVGDENLFDLAADPYEQQDLAGQPAQKELISKLRSQVLNWWHTTGGQPLAVESNLSPAGVGPVPTGRKVQSKAAGGNRPHLQPNILVIMADDLGYTDLGCYGCKDIRTPRLDKLAQQGMRFTSAYVTGAMCGPSRAGFITGRHQSFFGYYENARYPLDPQQGFPKGIGTVASYIQEQGYATGGVGKWHMGTADHQHPNVLGYADWFGFLGGGLTYYPMDHPNYRGRYETLPRPWGQRDMHHTLPILKNSEPVDWKKYVTHELTDAGVEFIAKERDEPFYLFMSYNAPHLELEAPEETIAKYPESAMTTVPGVTPHSRSVYAAMVDEMDQGIGRLLDTLDQRGQTENTVVIFLSDHGGMKRTSDNRPLRGAKGSAYEGGLRVPLIVRWPNRIKPGSVVDHPITSLDLGATTYAMAGGDPSKKNLDGVDLTDFITGQSDEAPHEMLFWHIGNPDRGIGVVRHGDYRLMIGEKKTALYDLKKDIGETTNIANANRAQVQLMKAAWNDWAQSRKPALWQATKPASRFQYSSYPWLKGSPHYKSEVEASAP